MLLEPRWDAEEFDMAKTRQLNRLVRSKADPARFAPGRILQLITGAEHIFSVDRSRHGKNHHRYITLDDLKAYYQAYFTPADANFHVAGNIRKKK